MADFGEGDVKPLFSKTHTLGLKLLVLALVSLTLMFMDQRANHLDLLRSTLLLVAEPIQYVAGLPAAVSTLGEYFQSRSSLEEENRTLKQRMLLLRAKAQRLDALEAENQRIRALLRSSETIHHRVLIAGVLSASPDPYRQSIMLDKGRLDGVYRGQALIDAYGVVGQVTEVGLTSSMALLITDPNHGIPVEINRTGLQTIAQGSGDGFSLRLPYLPRNANLKVGDLLVSSGLGGRYPPGYPVATVTRIDHRPGEYFLNVQARPAAHLRQGREVLLVWRDKARSAGETPRITGNEPARTPDTASNP